MTDPSYLPIAASTLVSYDTEYKNIIIGLMFFKKRVRYENLLKTLKPFLKTKEMTHLVRVPNYFGWPYYEEFPGFDLKSHVHELYLEKPGKDKQLEKCLRGILSSPLDPEKPLWEMLLLQDYYEDSKEGGTVIVYRSHHCLMDGMVAIRSLLALSEVELTDIKVSKKSSKGRPKMGFIHAMQSILQSGLKLICMRKDDPTIFTIDEARGEVASSVLKEGINLDEMKTVSKKYGATVNDLIISCMSGAIGKYLIKHVSPEESQSLKDYPPRVRSALWVDTRKIDWLTKKPTFPKKFSVDIGTVFIDVPMFDKNPIRRLKNISSQAQALLKTAEGNVTKAMMILLGWIPRPFSCFVWDFFASKVTFSMSNIPGPQYPVKFAGETLDRIYFLVTPQRKNAIFFCILSYNGKVFTGISSDPKAIQHPHLINEEFAKEFEKTKLAAQKAK